MKVKYKSLFISDVHLGTGLTNSKELIKLLTSFNGDRLFIIGDFIDVVAMKRKVVWDEDCSKVIKCVFALAKRGIEVNYIPGNHDYTFRAFDGTDIQGIDIHKKMIYTSIDGRKVLIKHGDEFDGFVKQMTFLYDIGDYLYEKLVRLNKPFSFIRRILGFSDRNFSLSMAVKTKVKGSINVINNFERLIVEKAKQYEADMVMCGHIHMPEKKDIQGITYMNTGCFTEICSYIVEDDKGEFHVKVMDKNSI